MTIKVGDKLPEATLMTMVEGQPAPVTTAEIFDGKRVVLFAVPGAFTPTCSAKHLPGFSARAEEIKGQGIDIVACLAVNDVFVMDAWAKDQGSEGKIMMLSDGNAAFSKALGLDADLSNFGMGLRSKRFALIAKDGVVGHLAVEPGSDLDVSSVDSILKVL